MRKWKIIRKSYINKRDFKKLIGYFLKSDIRDIEKSILQSDVVSFDLFDTLISRKGGNPESIFTIMILDHPDIFGNNDGSVFLKNRIFAEKKLRKKYNKEITIEQIYQEIKKKNIPYDINELEKIEINTEIASSRVNDIGKRLYNFAVQNNKYIIITSDMYLPLGVIEKILLENEYEEWSDIYLSSDKGCRKWNGLFDIVSEDFKGKRVLHIGDDVKNDFGAARKSGIMSKLI